MGLRDKYKNIINNTFKPLELNELNVQSIFNDCINASDTKRTTTNISSSLFDTAGGYDKDYQTVYFNAQKINGSKKTIKYLLGQLRTIHMGGKRISPEDCFFNYSNKSWTNNKRNRNGITLFS